MNCDKSQKLISSYLDRELDPRNSRAVRAHLGRCDDCARLYEDFDAILTLCDKSLAQDSSPPNSQALWRRINNIIETEVEPEIVRQKSEEASRAGWFSRFWDYSLQFSTSQVASAAVGIALVSSLLTIVAVKNFSGPSADGTGADAAPTIFEKVLADLGVGETASQKGQRRILQQKEAIKYWKARVKIRRAQWSADTKNVFDRNLNEIDKAVTEFTTMLSEDPQDTLSNEMLDSALKEKMELLREFSEL